MSNLASIGALTTLVRAITDWHDVALRGESNHGEQWRAMIAAFREFDRTHRPRVVAVRQCAPCQRILGVAEWFGAEARDVEEWTLTHGMCQQCLDKVELDCQAREAAA